MLHLLGRVGLVLLMANIGLLVMSSMLGHALHGGMIAFTRDSRQEGFQLMLMDVATARTVQITRDADVNSLPVWSPDGNTLAWLRGSSLAYFYAMDLRNMAVQPLTAPMSSGTVLSWSPDGRQAVFEHLTATGYNRIMLVDAITGELQPLQGTLGLHQTSASWSPDGSTLVYQFHEADIISQVALYDVATQQSRILSEGVGLHPSWSPDGRTVAYLQQGSTAPHLILKDIETTTERRYSFDGPLDYSPPQWSPDGRWLAFAEGASRIWLLDSTTDTLTNLSGGSRFQYGPVWAPDAQHLLVVEVTRQVAGITLIDVLSGTHTPLSSPTTSSNDRMPAWRP